MDDSAQPLPPPPSGWPTGEGLFGVTRPDARPSNEPPAAQQSTAPPAPTQFIPFTNDALDPSGLPRLEDETFIHLDAAYFQMRATVTSAVALLVCLVATAAVVALPIGIWILAPVLAAVIALTIFRILLVRIDARHRSWLVREHDLSYRSGVISQDVETVPFNRIQHVVVEQGPLERLFGLATVRVLTAGGILGLVQVSGLTHEVAEKLRSQLLSRVEATK